MKLFVVEEMGDPYEPGHTLAICTSLQRVQELFANRVVGIQHQGNWIDVRTGRPLTGEHAQSVKTWGVPRISCEEVESDIKFPS